MGPCNTIAASRVRTAIMLAMAAPDYLVMK